MAMWEPSSQMRIRMQLQPWDTDTSQDAMLTTFHVQMQLWDIETSQDVGKLRGGDGVVAAYARQAFPSMIRLQGGDVGGVLGMGVVVRARCRRGTCTGWIVLARCAQHSQP